jgi:hypothetical protein
MWMSGPEVSSKDTEEVRKDREKDNGDDVERRLQISR